MSLGPIDNRPYCYICKANRADVVENKMYFCAACLLKRDNIPERLKRLKPRKKKYRYCDPD